MERLTCSLRKPHTQNTIIRLLQKRRRDIVCNAEDEFLYNCISIRESYSVSKHCAGSVIVREYLAERDIGDYTPGGAFLRVVSWLAVMARDVRSRNPSMSILVSITRLPYMV
jgi:hypothetical protein